MLDSVNGSAGGFPREKRTNIAEVIPSTINKRAMRNIALRYTLERQKEGLVFTYYSLITNVSINEIARNIAVTMSFS